MLLSSMDQILRDLNSSNLYQEDMQSVLRSHTLKEREEIAFKTRTMVQYYDDEVQQVQLAEMNAALKAIPIGVEISQLNILDLGAGERKCGQSVIPVDGDHALRSKRSDNLILANVMDLPFKENSIDCIIALHTIEHLRHPLEAIDYWGTLLKPGGGIGLVIPDWRYTWDSKNDSHPWGHRWNPAPKEFLLYVKNNLSSGFIIESSLHYDYKISFSIVIRKSGNFKKFEPIEVEEVPSGAEIYRVYPDDFLQFNS
jgi:SAM-dependent methyltransferase